ncbi:MAG TPA: ABC transporter ATP-binding protein [Gemmatimonadales bacterium]|jgi:ABC-type multidrug transport system ATPase subunit|nr:ABC transporter ATP-binding protein [Gemmatimonadales bacterium]
MTSAPASTPPADLVLSARDISRRFGYRRVLNTVSLELYRGQVLLLVGANGAGKTTLLRVLAGLLRPSQGTVTHSAAVGLVAHDAMLYDALSAYENLAFFQRLHGGKDPARIRALLDQVGLADRADDRVGTFSRGMVQRVAIARALLAEPTLLLLDEPLTGLDERTTRIVLDVLTGLRDAGTAMMVVSHQPTDFLGVATHIARISKGGLTVPEPFTTASTTAPLTYDGA